MLEYRHLKLDGAKAVHDLGLPACLGVADLKGPGVVNDLVVQGDVVGLRHAGLLVEQAVNSLEAGVRYLADIFAYLYLGDYLALVVLDCAQLVNSAENGVGLRGDEPFADTESVYLRALQKKLRDKTLIKGIRHRYFALRPSGLVEHSSRLARQIRHVARVKANAAFRYAERPEHLVKRLYRIGNTAFERVVGIDKQCRVGGVGLAVCLERLVLAVEHLHP